MLKHRYTDKICCAIVALTLLVTVLFMDGASLGIVSAGRTMGYEARLFDTARVHTVDIVMDDWDGFLETCTNEEYSACSVVIDGEAYKNVGIRAKGNTSLSSVAAYGNDRYSFKVEFDKYTDQASYYGLDKLSLNNIIQDNTYLKDYLSYSMMRAAGALSPLASFVYITVNGEDWGLYLAVEGVEEGFLQRNYGTDYGNLYKPDSMSFGGGRGNGKEFNMEQFGGGDDGNGAQQMTPPDRTDFAPSATEGFEQPNGQTTAGDSAQQQPDGHMPYEETAGDSKANGTQPSGDQAPSASQDSLSSQSAPAFPGAGGGRGGGPGGGMGSSDVMLQYADDDPDSYQNIFDNAKTEITKSDKTRLISSLKTLSEGDEPASVVDVDAVIRYFVAHTFVRNDDSYTGSMIHNYYLYEENGVLSMIPWDYNLAFGGFGMGGGKQSSSAVGATSDVNYPIDSPVSNGDLSSRPMVAWIFESEQYLELYHQYYQQFIESYFDSGVFEEEFDRVVALISPYVEKDPTAFCTYEQFQAGVQTLREFCLLRAQSVSGQLDGSIPSTSEGQAADSSSLVDASHLSLSDMGSMGNGKGGGHIGEKDGESSETITRSALRPSSTAQDGTASAQQTDSGKGANGVPSGSAGTLPPDEQSGTSSTPPDAFGTAEGRSGGSTANAQASGSAGSSIPGSSLSADSTAAPDTDPTTQPQADAGQRDNPFGRDMGGRQGNGLDMPGGGQAGGADSGSAAAATLIWLGASVLVLAMGILIAWKTKH